MMDADNCKAYLISKFSDCWGMWNGMRMKGFDSFLTNEDWVWGSISVEDLLGHKNYLNQLVCELILSEKSAAHILYDDEYLCDSLFLRELKSERKANYGCVDKINESNFAYNLELSRGYIELNKVSSIFSPKNNLIRNQLFDEFENRRKVELNRFESESHSVLLTSGECLTYLYDQIESAFTGPVLRRKDGIAIAFCGGLCELLMKPFVVDYRGAAGGLGCSISVRINEGGESRFVLNVLDLFPRKFMDYTVFNSESEMHLLVAAWKNLCSLLCLMLTQEKDMHRTVSAPR